MSENFVCCQQCQRPLSRSVSGFNCAHCDLTFPLKDGLLFMGYDKRDEKYILTVIQEEKDSQTREDRIPHHWDFAQESFRFGKLVINNLLRIVDNPTELRTVELGAGGGAMSWLLAEAGFDTYCCELDPNSLYSGLVLTHPALGIGRRIVCDATLPPFADESIDVLFCKEFVHHVEQKQAFFEMVNSKLKMDGIFVLIEPLLGFYSWLYYLRHPDPQTDHFFVGLRTYLRGLRRTCFEVDRFGLFFYKESSPISFDARLRRMFNKEIAAGISKNRFAKMLYGSLINGSVVLFARKVQQCSRPTRRSVHLEIIPPATLTLGQDYLAKVTHFADLLRTVSERGGV
jgi:SAM-dependent methyltransferase